VSGVRPAGERGLLFDLAIHDRDLSERQWRRLIVGHRDE
jgi:hypothetical protein